MRSAVLSVAAAVGLAFGGAALAQDPVSPEPATPQENPSPPATDVSEADLEKFAEIYVDLQATAERYEPELTGSDSPEETLEVQTRLRDESLQQLSDHGWTLDRYNMVVQAINANPTLAERVVQMIEERS